MPKKIVSDGLTEAQREARANDPLCKALDNGWPLVDNIFPMLVQVATELYAHRKVGDQYQAVLEATWIILEAAKKHPELVEELQTNVNIQCEKTAAKFGRKAQPSPLEHAVMSELTRGQGGS